MARSETAAKLNAPVIIQFSNGGAAFNAGKGLSNADEKAAIAGGIAGAKHIHTLAEAYGATVILHTDHCAKNFCHGSTGCSTLRKSILPKPESRFTVRTCSICRKNRFMKISKSAKNTSNA
jgi:fructose/tagatose bisphosphate aldolase